MIACPEFDYDYAKSHAVYLWCLRISSIISLVVNPAIVGIIFFHSTKHMATYRWYLILHQVAAFICDLWINLCTEPVFLIPFPAAYILGFARHFVSTQYTWTIGFIFIVYEQITVILLFSYRYWVVQGDKRFSLGWKCFALLIFMFITINIYLLLAIEIDTEETFDQLAKKYTCVTPQLRQIDTIVVLDKTKPSIIHCIYLIIFDATAFIITVVYFTIGSVKATRTCNMSLKLRQMQQKFLFQLCLQSFLPLLVVIGPIVLMVSVGIFDIFGYTWLNDIVMCCGSCFSVIGAIILVLMNPSYHQWLTRYFLKKETKLHRISAIKSTTQRSVYSINCTCLLLPSTCHMIECAEFTYDYKESHDIYLWCLRVFTIIDLVVNPFIIYCIIFRSTSHMATYRWFLLLHQIAALSSDLWLNFFAQPIFFIPFTVVFMPGFARHFLSTKHIWNVAQVIIVFEQITVMFLFFYRYRAVHNSKAFPPLWKGALILLLITFLFNIYLPLTIEIKTEEVFERLANNYTCIKSNLREIDSIIAVEKWEAMKSLGLTLFDALFFLVIVFSLSVGCSRATRTRSMSPKLRQMQQRFLFQLCLQSFVPFLVVIGPIVVLVFIVIFDVFGYSWINDIVWSSSSVFSITSAIILFIMNPTYHQWLTRQFIKKRTNLPMLS